MQKLIELGRIQGVHGIRGQVKLYSHCRPREDILRYRYFTARRANGETFPLTLEKGQSHGQSLIAQFADVHDRDQALALNGCILLVPREALPELKAGEYYWADLIGLTVKNRAGATLGRVRDIFETGANDVLVVKADDKKEEILIPLVIGQYVERVDFAQETLFVDWESDWLD